MAASVKLMRRYRVLEFFIHFIFLKINFVTYFIKHTLQNKTEFPFFFFFRI